MRLFPNSLSLGLAALGRPGYINLGRGSDMASAAERTKEQMQAQAFETMDAFFAAGGRHIDAARSYGLAEEFLSKWLTERGPAVAEQIIVSSKWGYRYTADWAIDNGDDPHEVKEHTAAHLRSQSHETIALLPTCALYQTHSALPDSGAFSDEVLEELRRLQQENGWRIGVSTSGPDQAAAIALACKNRDLFSCVQTTFNALAQASGPALEGAAKEGFDVIVKEGMANGRLWFSPPQALKDEAVEQGVSVDALALGLVLAAPFRPQVLSGAVGPAQIKSNMAALEIRDMLLASPGKYEALMGACRQDEVQYWADRAALQWQ